MRDILTDDQDDLAFDNGDLAVGFSDYQHQKDLLRSSKGEWKQHPEIGVGIIQMLGDDQYGEILIEAKKNLQYDGMTIRNILFEDHQKLTIDGHY